METLAEVLVGRSTDFVLWTLRNYLNQINGQLNHFEHLKASFERNQKDEDMGQFLAEHIEKLEAERLTIKARIAVEQRAY